MLIRTIVQFASVALVLFCLGCQKDSEAIVSIALHPTNANILYVATNDAVYKSRDGGQLWEKFPSFSARRVTTVAIDPQLPATPLVLATHPAQRDPPARMRPLERDEERVGGLERRAPPPAGEAA